MATINRKELYIKIREMNIPITDIKSRFCHETNRNIPGNQTLGRFV
jgi:hypothetical protein